MFAVSHRLAVTAPCTRVSVHLFPARSGVGGGSESNKVLFKPLFPMQSRQTNDQCRFVERLKSTLPLNAGEGERCPRPGPGLAPQVTWRDPRALPRRRLR